MAGNRFIQPARMPGAGTAAPYVVSGRYTTGQTFLKGALLVLTAAGELSECAADPTLVSGVALEGAGTKPGTGIAGGVTQVTGIGQEVSYVPADVKQVFSCRALNGGTDPVTPLQTHIGESYGAVKDANGIWCMDMAETTTLIFTIVDIDIDSKQFYVQFHPTAIV